MAHKKGKKITATDIRAMAKRGELSPARAAKMLYEDSADIMNARAPKLNKSAVEAVYAHFRGKRQDEAFHALLHIGRGIQEITDVGDINAALAQSALWRLLYSLSVSWRYGEPGVVEGRPHGFFDPHYSSKWVIDHVSNSAAILEVAQAMERLLGIDKEKSMAERLEILLERMQGLVLLMRYELKRIQEKGRKEIKEGIPLIDPIEPEDLQPRPEQVARWREFLAERAGPNWWEVEELPEEFTASEAELKRATVEALQELGQTIEEGFQRGRELEA